MSKQGTGPVFFMVVHDRHVSVPKEAVVENFLGKIPVRAELPEKSSFGIDSVFFVGSQVF